MEGIHHLQAGARAMTGQMGFPDQAHIKSVDLQLLIGQDGRILPASI
jgi:hypothetical protein